MSLHRDSEVKRPGLIISRFHSYFDVTGIEPSIPLGTKREDAVSIYNWSPKNGSRADNYPPHLDLIPKTDEVAIFKIFDNMRLLVGTIL